MSTQQQILSQRAYELIFNLKSSSSSIPDLNTYKSIAQRFPALIHSTGLVQAITFAFRDEYYTYLVHLAQLVDCVDASSLASLARTLPLLEYQRLSIKCLLAAH